MTDVQLPTSEILESQQNVWESDLQPAGCPKCSQAFLVEPARIGLACPACGVGRLESQPARLRLEPPEPGAPGRRLRSRRENWSV